jgi:uncharacterized membrane protein (UPF0136 family)
MTRRTVGLTYAAVTSALIVAIAASGWCWETKNSSGLSNLELRDVCIDIWALSGLLLALSQIAFLVIAARKKHHVVLVCAGGILLVIAWYVYMLSKMPS